MNVQAAARGHGVGVRLQASARHAGGTWLAQLRRLELHHPALEVSLRRPTQLSWSPRRGITLEQTRLAVWGGDLELGGRWQPRAPRGELHLRARRVRLPGAGPVSVDLQARLQARQLTGELSARLEQGGSLHLAAELPLRPDWKPDCQRPLELEVQLADLDLRRLSAVLPERPALAGRLSRRAASPAVSQTLECAPASSCEMETPQVWAAWSSTRACPSRSRAAI